MPVAVAALAVRAQVHVANVALVGAGACLVALVASLVTSHDRSIADLERHRKLGGTEDAQSSDPFPTPIPDQTVSLPATATGLQFSRDEVRGGE